jgi:hypothetical protein
MAISELLRRLEEEKEALLNSAGDIKDLYRSLSESIRTLTVPFRRSFAPESNIQAALDPEAREISFYKHDLQSSEGEVQNNSRWLTGLINNISAIRNTYMTSPRFIELKEIGDIRRVHADIRQFLENLFLKNSVWILQDPNSEASVLARQKKKDIDELLSQRIDPFFETLELITIDEYSVRLRMEIQADIASLQNYNKNPDAYDVLIKERCDRLGLRYEPELIKAVVQDLEVSDESLEKRIADKYAQKSEDKKGSPSQRRRYMRILHRYLARTKDVGALLPIIENIYFLYQPKPKLIERLRSFLARLAGRERQTPRKDIQYTYIIGRESIERKKASLENLIRMANELEKDLLKVKNYIRSAQVNKRIKTIRIGKIRTTIDSIRSDMRQVFEDCFGLVQWLGKKSNQDKLAKLSENTQRDLNYHLDAIYATIIINSERLKEISRKYSPSSAISSPHTDSG